MALVRRGILAINFILVTGAARRFVDKKTDS
jgi:hypothetical protein